VSEPGRSSRAFWVAWHALPLAILLLIPSVKFGIPFWALETERLVPWAVLTIAFLLSSLIPSVCRMRGQPPRYALIMATTIAVFGLAFLFLWVSEADFSRAVVLGVFTAALLLAPMPFVRASVKPTLTFIAVSSLGVLLVWAYGRYGPAPVAQPNVADSVLESGYYDIRATTYAGFVAKPAVPGGGIARIRDRYLLITGDGQPYLLDWSKSSDALSAKAIPVRVPVNGQEFSAAAGVEYRDKHDTGKYDPTAAGTVQSRWFRVGGVLVDESGERVRVFASHHFWKSREACFVVRVSMLDSDSASLLAGAPQATWKTVYETSPCLPITGEGRRRGTPFAGLFMGGRLALLDDHTLLLTVGDHGFDGVNSRQVLPQDAAAAYGKTVLIHLDDGSSEIYTSGHRNPQGLLKDRDGALWLAEQGPRGGDELNLLARGKNYGWPYITYGTDYYSLAWPLHPPEGSAQNFEGPQFAWLPSIAVSNLIQIEQDRFHAWKGDFLVGSLAAQSLFRIRMKAQQVALVEPIKVGSRIRDLTEGADGRIVLWTDDATLISLLPEAGTSGELLFDTRCGGCHRAIESEVHSIGPDLFGIVDRRIASAKGYKDYSPVLRALTGSWTVERLDGFLANPQGIAPGTTMEFPGVQDREERHAIIEYLQTLR
jgi:cytochrome c2